MNAIRYIAYLSLVLLLGACATATVNEKPPEKIVSIAKLDTGAKYGYIIGPDGLDTLINLGVVCKDDEVVLRETDQKFGSYVYCENDVMAQQHAMLIKLDMVPIANSSKVLFKYVNAWISQASLNPWVGDGITCLDRSKRDRPALLVWKSSFSDCTLTYHGRKYFIAVASFGAKEFRNSTQLLVLGNLQDPSEEAKAKTRLLTEEIAQSFISTRKSAKRLK